MGGSTAWEQVLDAAFERAGKVVAYRPKTWVGLSFLLTMMMGGGYGRLINETRPEEQWVAAGSVSLDHNQYIGETWASEMRFNFHMATCKNLVDERPDPDCNMLDVKYLKRLNEKYTAINQIVVDGRALADSLVSKNKAKVPDIAERTDKYRHGWSFDYVATEDGRSTRKCFEFGPFCAGQSMMDVFRGDDRVVSRLDQSSVDLAVRTWPKQKTFCPVTIARADSPCIDASIDAPGAPADACQEYNTDLSRSQCRLAAQNYCARVCPTKEVCPGAPAPCRADFVDPDTCEDSGCLQMQTFSNMEADADEEEGQAPESAFQFEPFGLENVLGSTTKSSDGTIESANVILGWHALRLDTVLIDGAVNDFISEEWEKEALCVLGIHTIMENSTHATKLFKECPEDDLIHFTAFYGRSFSDTFGVAIRGDLPKMGMAYVLMLVYLFVMLSRRDPVHSMMGLSFVVLLCVLFAYACAFGLCGYLGVKNSQLNSTVLFLLLGLGVDDGFVLVAEYTRATKLHPEATVEERVVTACKEGGLSIFITSLTDMMAFLIGSMTVLPALSWFCIYAGLGVMFCFIFQIIFLLPCMVLNAKRADAGRRDCCCCLTTEPRSMFEPRGCCFCCKCEPDLLEKTLRDRFGKAVLGSPAGRYGTLVLFFALTVVGLVGASGMEKDFKLQWFIPDDTYPNQFFDWNDEYFMKGQSFNVYLKDMDYAGRQDDLTALSNYLTTDSPWIDRRETIDDWFAEFKEFATEEGVALTPKSTFYTNLHDWLQNGGGARQRGSIQWQDSSCDEEDSFGSCDPTLGIRASRMSATLHNKFLSNGGDRYECMTSLRDGITAILGDDGFAFSRDFLFWEEVGVIDTELKRNLLTCGAVICGIVLMLIPRPKIAFLAIACTLLAIVNVIGYAHYMGISISGVSTIYILIAVGLAVDYSVHIAHFFKHAEGTGEERALEALGRIGPPVFHAVLTMMLAVAVLSSSSSFIFRVLFKVFFLVVVFGGSYGLWLLPVLLSMVGGDQPRTHTEEAKGEMAGA